MALDSQYLNLPTPRPLPGSQIGIPLVIIADDAFSLGLNSMKIIASRDLTHDQEIPNYRISKALKIVQSILSLVRLG